MRKAHGSTWASVSNALLDRITAPTQSIGKEFLKVLVKVHEGECLLDCGVIVVLPKRRKAHAVAWNCAEVARTVRIRDARQKNELQPLLEGHSAIKLSRVNGLARASDQ